MKYFIATVLVKGKKVEEAFYANDIKEANQIARVKFHGIIIKVVEAEEPLEIRFKKFQKDFFQHIRKKKIKPDALVGAIRQLAVMTNAGISIHDSLVEIVNSSEDETLQSVFKKLADDINAGHSLSKAMENFRYELGNLTIAMVQLGEKTGNLDEALYTLANMLEEIRANVVKFKKAMAYPRNVMVAMGIAFTILISFVVPKFKTMFEKLHADLPLPTKILLGLEHIFNTYGVYILPLLIVAIIVFKYMLSNYENVRYGWHQFLLRVYLIKDIIKFATLSRFTLVFSELIHAGIPIAEALDTTTAMIDNLPLKQKLMSVKQTVEKGGTLHQSLKDLNLFENMIIQMVKAGEDSGTLDKMVKKVAEYYKMRFDAIIDGLSDAIEPVMLIIIASLVLLLALGIFMPMWNMGQAVQAG
ncbi:Type II secretion system protein [hydrothermal vent metagenome]|uniref:Type II secretion system protein n=1 Tax=hydrothermal vent metagenome TaxID=652676 RepID=A0A1W1D4I4_9ZZZZ